MNLRDELEKYITTAFAREQEFLDKFFPGSTFRLHSLHMASGEIIIGLERKYYYSSAIYKLKSTEEFMTWCEELWEKEGLNLKEDL